VPGLAPRPFFVPRFRASSLPGPRCSPLRAPCIMPKLESSNPKRRRLARGTFVQFARIIRPPAG